MSSLLALLSQQTPNLQTRKGLILTGLQHDFVSPDGKLPVSNESGFLDRLQDLVTEFRPFGDVIWVRTEFEATRVPSELDENGCNVITSNALPQRRTANEASDAESDEGCPTQSKKRKADRHDATGSSMSEDSRQKQLKPTVDDAVCCDAEGSDIDEELFLSKTATREPCCVKGSRGADYAAQFKQLVEKKDLQVVKSYYSAFSETSLLLTLRSKLITELFVCGCMTNMSVYATAMDAARYGIKITLVSDCLGYRKRDRHNLAIKRLVDIMEANVVTSKQAIERLKNPPSGSDAEEDEEDEESDVSDDNLAVRRPGHSQNEPGDLLEADSDDEESDYEPTSVRNFPLRRMSLALRQARSSHPSLSSPGVESSLATPSNGRKSSSTASTRQTRDSAKRCTSGGSAKDKQTKPASSTSKVNDSLLSPRSLSHRYPDNSTHNTEYLEVRSGLETKCLNTGSTQGEPIQSAMKQHQSHPLFGPGTESESVGSRILYGLMPDNAEGIFEALEDEVNWQHMRHKTGDVPRLVCCQGTISKDGTMPVYRHPSDETLPLLPWTPAVDSIRKAAEDAVGHELNHALIQLYRGGTDFISEHSDKTLDVSHGSSIVNVSFGAERTMRLRTKRTEHIGQARTTHRVRMPHNSMITMSLETNAQYLHGINANKRLKSELSEVETAFGGQRISLTFRKIGTYLSGDSKYIFGQGAIGKTTQDKRPTVNGNPLESEKLAKAFGLENASSSIDWVACYGNGSDVLHLRGPA